MNGFVNVLKPVGATASDVVVCVKRALNAKKAGHLGTMDPGASGVLPVAVGQGTKLFSLLTEKTKKYRAFFTFGKTTDTLDSYGVVTGKSSVLPTFAQLQSVLMSFVGEFDQIPPAYSAKSVNGVRAYKLARNGVEVELKPRRIVIFDIKSVSQLNEATFIVDIECGGGTYIRSIARDVAETLGTLGYMSGLIRLQSGDFSIENAYTLQEIQQFKEKCVLDISYPLKNFESAYFKDEYFNDIDCGRKVRCPFDVGYRKIYCNGVFFGLGCNANGFLKIDYYLKNVD